MGLEKCIINSDEINIYFKKSSFVLTQTQNSSRERARSSSEAHKSQRPQISRLNIKPLVNVESEQLKAIVRQGRKLRKTEGSSQDPPVQIFAPNKPPVDQMTTVLQVEPRHHLIQHSEYKYEKTVVMPFYLHQPPPVPHPSPEHHQVNGKSVIHL